MILTPSLLIFPLVIVILYLLNERHEKKLKEGVDELITPVKKDNLFDLPKAEKPTAPSDKEHYIPPAETGARLGRINEDNRVAAVIKQTESNLAQQPVSAPAQTAQQMKTQQQLQARMKVEQAKRVAALKAKLAQVQKKKNALSKMQNSGKMETNKPQQIKGQSNAYQTLKPTMQVKLKDKE